MKNDYFKKIFYLVGVDKNDNFLKKVERWKAHKKGILHRGFTVILSYKDKFILQKRKHIVFDNFWDFSFSSHPIFIGDKIQDDKEAILNTLKREWIIDEKINKNDIKFLEKFYYKAVDKKSNFIEHEINYLYFLNLKNLPQFNFEFAYDMKIISKNDYHLFKDLNFAPWVKLDKFLDYLD